MVDGGNVKSMSERKRYDDKFRASAVIMLEAQGYPHKEGALQTVANHLGVPHSTLHRWFHGKQNVPPSDLVHEKRIDFTEAIKAELAGILGDMPSARQDAGYKDLATAFGIMLDKLQLLENKPTQINEERHSGNITLTTEQRNQRIAELLDTARSRGAGLPAIRSDNSDLH